MLPAISLQTSPNQQKDTSGSPVVSGPRELPSMPPSSTIPTQFPMGQPAPQAQQSAAISNQFTRAGYFNHINLFALAFPSWMNSLLKRFVKHLITWDKATVIAAVAIVLLAIWTATKDYIEHCQGEQKQVYNVERRPPKGYLCLPSTDMKTVLYCVELGLGQSLEPPGRERKMIVTFVASTMFYAAWNAKHLKLLRILRESFMPAQYDVERQPQDLGHCTKDTCLMDLAGKHASAALPRRNSGSRSVTVTTTSQDNMESRKLRQRTIRTTKKNELPTGKLSNEVYIEQQPKRKLIGPVVKQEQDAVPNTDGQILVPVRKKQPVLPQPNIPGTVPPSQGPPGKRVPIRRSGARPRPQSPLFHRPVYRSRIRRPEALRLEQSQTSKYHSNKRLEARKLVSRRVGAINSSTRYLQNPNTGTLGSHASNQGIIANRSKFLRPKENSLIKAKHEHANIMSLSYIMEQQPSAQEVPSASDEIEERVIKPTASSQSGEEYESEDELQEEMPLLIRNNSYSRDIPNISNSRHHNLNQTNVAALQDSLLNKPVKLEDIERAVRSVECGSDTGTSGIIQFRAGRKLPPIKGRGAGYSQYRLNYMSSSPLILPRSIPRTPASHDLSTLEHTAITTLASLNRFFDSKKLYTCATTSAPNPDSPAPTNESDQTHSHSLKRSPSRISNLIPAEIHQSTSPTSPEMTELDPSKKRIRISSILNPTSTPSVSTSPTPRNQTTGPLRSDTPLTHDSIKLASDFENDTLMLSLPSDAYPSPPKSASLSSSIPLTTSPRPLVPRDTSPSILLPKKLTDPQSHLDPSSDRAYRSPAPSPSSLPQSRDYTPALTGTAPRSLVPMITDIRNPNPTPQSQLLFFGHQAYSPLPARASPVARSSSPPLSSPSTKPDSRSLPRKNFAYRAWKMRPSRSILTGLSGSSPPQYLVVIRNDDRSKTIPSSGASDENGNMGKWWSVLPGKEGLDNIRKIFEER
ncbi:uncharacterized protein Bfra_006525 [Botrytis fragariae]|uniref:Uncharacterized protein n=1 Tax=Botrytis fragariae TaxID=1964551 RepID=A0A8H6EP21_9HELO|nr:uncharacterized protein Bfra_006525 [Botrytis fragariae]KAF5879317.1 hypothetical protein Bfra_006525 [Botrytis fragariae]